VSLPALGGQFLRRNRWQLHPKDKFAPFRIERGLEIVGILGVLRALGSIVHLGDSHHKVDAGSTLEIPMLGKSQVADESFVFCL